MRLEWFTRDVKPFGIPKQKFLRSEWEAESSTTTQVSSKYLLWRGAYVLFCIFAVVHSASLIGGQYWFVYLTHWSILTQLIYGLLYLIDLIIYRVISYADHCDLEDKPTAKRGRMDNVEIRLNNNSKPDDDEKTVKEKLPRTEVSNNNTCLEAVVWALLSIVGIMPYFVTVGYWAIVYKPGLMKYSAIDGIYVHGINALMSLLDTFIIAIPVRLAHVVYLLIFASAYILFSGVYELAGATYPEGKHCIYSILDWHDEPKMSAVCVVVSGVIGGLMYCVLWGLYKLRLLLVSKVKGFLLLSSSDQGENDNASVVTCKAQSMETDSSSNITAGAIGIAIF